MKHVQYKEKGGDPHNLLLLSTRDMNILVQLSKEVSRSGGEGVFATFNSSTAKFLEQWPMRDLYLVRRVGRQG